LAAIVVRRGRSKEIAHVMVQVGQDARWREPLYLDIRGVRGLPDFFDDLEIDSGEEEASVIAVDVAQIMRWVTQSRGGLGSLSEAIRTDAAEIASQLLEQVAGDAANIAAPVPY
jgi:hypothetical protein